MMPKRRLNAEQLTAKIRELAYNLWWAWNPRAQAVFEDLSPLTWEATRHNPVAVLSQVSDMELRAYLNDRDFLGMVLPVLDDFQRYMKARGPLSPAAGSGKNGRRGPVAYFCAEYGVHECLNFYSGGLGVLAGDHLKSASDLGLPFVAIGLFYRRGYFAQRIDQGRQVEEYPTVDPALIPVRSVRDASGKPVVCSLMIGDEVVFFEAWRVDVGRSVLYLLDTDVPENSEQTRGLTSLAYGGDSQMRIRQEAVLGIGGVKLLRALGLRPSVFHMNEGHAAFLTLELLREEMQRTGDLAASESAVRSRCVFTTHTPVPAGHDRFPRELIEHTLRAQCAAIGIDTDRLMSYGSAGGEAGPGHEFTMTVLGLKFSRAANGVSAKHGEISALMWRDLYPDAPAGTAPIGHITNGIHVSSWASRRSWEFWERHNSHRWKEEIHHPRFWKHLTDPAVVSDEELWSLRYTLRRDLIEFVRRRAQQRRVVGGPTGNEALYKLLSYDTLTIGFARRFAPYKRAPLLFSDMAKAVALFNDPARPLQLIYAGKAHPRDGGGKDFIRRITELCDQPTFHGRIVFLEDYDINVARMLVSGCDVWLNTPRRPLEASGTSGQKVAINGGLHLSVLDGWWIEGYDGKNGWAIGGLDPVPESSDEADAADASSLYRVLQSEVIPAFYSRDSRGIPKKWISMIRGSLRTLIPVFNTHRMVTEYARKYYYPK